MTLKAFLILLSRQIKQKFGRFVLASGGIMIGVWAITLTNGLSLGLNDTIVDAINSQPLAKEISLNKTKEKVKFNEIPVFVSMSLEEIQNLQDYEGVKSALPRDYLTFFIKSNDKQEYKCTETKQEMQALMAGVTSSAEQSLDPDQIKQQVEEIQSELAANCTEVTSISNVYENFYENHRTKWLGSTTAPKRGEIVTCFKCGGLEFNKYMGVDRPEDLLGKKIYMELSQSPSLSEVGDEMDVSNFNFELEREDINSGSVVELEIISVIDDRDSNNFSLTGGASNNFYLDFSYYMDAVKLANPDVDLADVGFFEAVVILEDYTDLKPVLDKFGEGTYLATSIAQILINAVDTVLSILQAVLFGFGLIILTASVFGIIAVMIISVLERKKEIGILKAMGAKDGDIFWLFLMESGFLGFLGWFLGTMLFYLCALTIQQTFLWFLSNNEDWKNNLETFNIDNFTPIAPWWLLLSTLSVSVLFTAVSGLYPSIKAARQNPVDVLRNE